MVLNASNRQLSELSWLQPFGSVVLLDLRHNQLRSCAGIEACVALRDLDVRDNLLDDTVGLICQLADLKALERVDARHNPFSRHFSGSDEPPQSPLAAASCRARLYWRARLTSHLPALCELDGS